MAADVSLALDHQTAVTRAPRGKRRLALGTPRQTAGALVDLQIYQVDAFTNELFAGNPAAVVPLEQWLDDSLMQQIAAENNLAETAFFVPLGEAGNHWHIRWFTPAVEVPLCGHATLASAAVIRRTFSPASWPMGFLALWHLHRTGLARG